MADVVVGIVGDYLVQQIQHQAQVLSELKGKVDLIQKKLQRLEAFLKDSQGKRDNEKVKVVINQIREAAYKIEDVIDNYIVAVIRYKKRTLAGKVAHAINHTVTLKGVNDEIDQLMKEITDIYNDVKEFDIKPGEHGKTDESEVVAARIAELVNKRRSDVEEDEVVGFGTYSEEVIKLLVEGNSSLDVVSIVGMAGLGKTTLARKVYKDPRISKRFHCCTWQAIGEKYNVKDILLDILRSLNSIPEHEVKLNKKNNTSNESQSDREAAEKQVIAMMKMELRRHLSDMRYLIVLDDVWHKDIWDDIKEAFPDDGIGSRVLITSRREKEVSKISSTISNTHPYQLQRLQAPFDWVLFSKKVFRGEEYRQSFETLGKRIVEDCKGLPLSIVVIAGILRSKERSEREWEKVVGHVSSYINDEDALVREIVRLSYVDLPLHLKPCFLYFGIYPEDYEIPVRQLIQFWVAEGFIPKTETRTPEDIAENYLEELIRRSLIQVERRRTDGGVKTCRIHDLFRDLCMEESRENQILEVRKDFSNEGKPRRLSVHCNALYYMSESSCDHSSTRSFFCFYKDGHQDASGFMRILSKNLKLLRVLDMGKASGLNFFIDKLCKFYHLRYYRAIANDSIHSKINDICNLLYLETLDLRATPTNKLPERMWDLKQLRHLYINGWEISLPIIPGKKSLPNLQTLSTIRLDEQTVDQLKKIPNLRKLGVHCLSSKSSNSLELLRKLQRLNHLNTLKIFYCKDKLTSVSGFPPNITKITLVGGNTLYKTVKALGSVPKLRYLKISGFSSDELDTFKLECDDPTHFPELLVLKMKGLKCESWNVVQGAMSQLQSLVINRCEFSSDLPSAQSFTTLQEVQVLWSSKEVVNKFQNMELKDSCKLTVYPLLGDEEEDDED